MSEEDVVEGREQAPPRWQPLNQTDRRVAGVLVEKAKTTPSAYPMTVNAITSGCNQKSNRFPTIQLAPEDVEESLQRLRHLGAVGQIEGHGRVDKYRHYLYAWLGVDKVELSVMTELLLRGPQTVGELRARAARMDPIADLNALQPILQSLKAKGLVLSLTPEGRGHVVTHALFMPSEMERIKAEYGAGTGSAAVHETNHGVETPPKPAVAMPASSSPLPSRGADELAELRSTLAQLRADLDDLTAAHEEMKDALRRLREDLGA
jgi:uncharacterized protein YceH (UPF0502 family)